MLNANYDYQIIGAGNLTPYSQDRSIYGIRLGYFSEEASKHYNTEGYAAMIGFAHDIERYGTTLVPKDDLFLMFSLAGLRPFGPTEIPIDLAIAPAVLTSANGVDASQKNAQYRTTASAKLRIVDPPADVNKALDQTWQSVSLWLLLRQDTAIQGPSWFENYRVGLQMDTTVQLAPRCDCYVTLSVGYDFQSFYNIKEVFHQIGARASLRF